jgi:hypothetical protein
MCEDWITEKYIDDVRNAAKNNYAAIKRIRELHKPVKSYKGRDHTEIVGCHECEETGSGREYYVEYPCPTIQALDGEKSE